MKKYMLSHRVRNAISMAILLQSIIFGIGLVVTGTFSGTANSPYKVMESQVAEKNSLLSGYMNNALLLTHTMEKELGQLTNDEEIQNRLIDNLNHSMSVDGVFYVDLDTGNVLVFHDGEPNIYSSTYSDVSCSVGYSQSSYSIALSKDWRPKPDEEEWAEIRHYWDNRGIDGQWFFGDGRLYYAVCQETEGSRRIIGLEIGEDMMAYYLKLDDPPYKEMKILLLSESKVRSSRDGKLSGMEYAGDDKTNHISLTYNGVKYGGVRSTLQAYGYMSDGIVYVASVCHYSELTALSKSTVMMVAGVYLLSIAIAVIFSYIAIWLVLKPIERLQEDIACQKPEEVHFKESGIVEIDRIHQALNNMAAKLEQSHSRYSFAMESAGENVGSFEYQEEEKIIKLSASIWKIMDVPADWAEEDGGMEYSRWVGILNRLERVEELEDGYSFVDRMGSRRAVSIRQRFENQGVFGMVIDKTDAYREIVRLRNISQHDQLTGLYNGSYLKKEGQRILDENSNKVNALVFCDLDNLKYVNDHFGHEMGDKYLTAMAELLLAMAKGERCIAVRLSGDEFALFFYGYNNRGTIEKRIRDEYEKRPLIQMPDGTRQRINASIGLAYAQRGRESVSDLINRADRAMYRVKHNQKNDIAIYDKSDEAELI